MTGPEHYREAERLLAEHTEEIAAARDDLDARPDRGANARTRQDIGLAKLLLDRAQVHATLALASAQALQPVAHFMGDDPSVTDWGRAIGHQQAPPAVLA